MTDLVSSATRVVRVHSVTLLGVGFVAVAAGYAAIRDGPSSTLLLETSLPLVVGIGLLWYGFRTARTESGADRATVVSASVLAGTALLVVVALWAVHLHELRTGIDRTDLAQISLLAATVGGGAGALVGHVYSSFTEQYRSTLRLSRTMDSAMDGIAILEGGTHVYANDAYADLYGLPGTEAIEGEPWRSVFTNEAQASVEREVFPAVAERSCWRGRLTGVRPDGSTIPMEVTVTAVEEGYAIVTRDVSEQREREQRIQVLNRVLRHNLRNSLTVIQGHANLLAERAPAVEADHVEPIRDEITDLNRTADKARGVERTLERRGEYGVIAPSDAVRTVVDRATAAHPDATVLSQVEESRLPPVDASVVDALDELVDNAVEHAERDGPTVEVSVRSVRYATGSRIEFGVADDGPGIPDSERQAVLQGEETPLDHGSGLGLWLVAWIVRNAGGDLRFGERADGGTVVTISFADEREVHERRTEVVFA